MAEWVVVRRGWAVVLLLLGASAVSAQQPATLEEAVRAALASAPSLAAAVADTASARALVSVARQWPNPGLALEYTKDAPNYHFAIEQAIDYPWLRRPRIQAARADADVAAFRLELERARIRYQVTVAHAAAAVAGRILEISASQSADGAELVRIAQARRDAGDASDLDVDIARVSAAQLRSAFLSDSLQLVSATLELQSLMWLPVDSVRLAAEDTVLLALPPVAPADSALAVSALEAASLAAAARLREQQRARFPVPALRGGFETGVPAGDEPALLPTVGISIPLPIFHRYGGEIAAARAETQRAAAELAEARREAALALARAARERELAGVRLQEDRAALASAQRVAQLSLAAYREGATPLATALEALRSAREAERQVLEDAASLRIADAALALARLGGVRP